MTVRTIGALVLVTVAGLWAVPTAEAAPAKIIGAPLVYIRSGPSASEEPLEVLSEGTRLETLGVEGAWTRVRVAASGREGYVYNTFLEVEPEPAPTRPPPTPEPPVGMAPGEGDPEALGEALPAGNPAVGGRDEPPPPTPDPFLLEEVARLRTEVDSLKRQVREELVTSGNPEEAEEGDLADPALRSTGIAVIFLVIGWLFGMAYARRRTQRPRLRF